MYIVSALSSQHQYSINAISLLNIYAKQFHEKADVARQTEKYSRVSFIVKSRGTIKYIRKKMREKV